MLCGEIASHKKSYLLFYVPTGWRPVPLLSGGLQSTFHDILEERQSQKYKKTGRRASLSLYSRFTLSTHSLVCPVPRGCPHHAAHPAPALPKPVTLSHLICPSPSCKVCVPQHATPATPVPPFFFPSGLTLSSLILETEPQTQLPWAVKSVFLVKVCLFKVFDSCLLLASLT